MSATLSSLSGAWVGSNLQLVTSGSIDLGADISGAVIGSQFTREFTISDLPSGDLAVSVINGEYRVNGGAYTSAPGTASNGDVITVRMTASSVNSASITTTFSVGPATGSVTVTTLAADGAAPQLLVSLPSFIEIPVGSYFELDLNDYFADYDSLLSYSLVSGDMPPGMSIDNSNGKFFGTPSVSADATQIVFRGTETNDGRFTDSNTVTIEITGLNSALGRPSKRHGIFRENSTENIYSQLKGAAVKYSWSFDRFADSLLANIESIEWKITNGTVSNVLRDGGYTSAIISVQADASVMIKAVFSDGSAAYASMIIQADKHTNYGMDYTWQ